VIELPTGTVTFLFTDIEGSTRLLKQLGEHYAAVLAEHQQILRKAVEERGGREIDNQGEAFFFAFATANSALDAAVVAQRTLAAHEWANGNEVRVRMGLHTGEPAVGGERYVGLGVHRAARIGAVGHGGQVLLSTATRELVDVELPGVSIRDLGSYRLKDIDRFERLYQLDIEGLVSDFPPLNAERVAQPHQRRRRLLGALAAVIALVAVVAAALLSRAGGAPAVTAESLVKIDVETNRIVDVIPVGRSPREVEVVGDYVFVASEADGTLTRVDLRTGSVTNSGQYDASDGLAAEGDERLWVASVGRDQVAVVDVELPVVDVTERLQAPRVPLRSDIGGTSLAVGGGSLWIVITRDASGVEQSPGSSSAVERWRLHPLRREQTFPLKLSDFGRGIAFGYGAAWIALGSPAEALLRIDAQSGRATRIKVGNYPGGPAVGFGSVWAVMLDDDTVWRLDPVTGRPQQIVPVGNGPWSVAVGSDSVWVTNECDGTVSRVDPDTNTVVETIETGYQPRWLAVGGGFVWVGVTGVKDECRRFLFSSHDRVSFAGSTTLAGVYRGSTRLSSQVTERHLQSGDSADQSGLK
jgi:YVTN family beta-propeller protein